MTFTEDYMIKEHPSPDIFYFCDVYWDFELININKFWRILLNNANDI